MSEPMTDAERIWMTVTGAKPKPADVLAVREVEAILNMPRGLSADEHYARQLAKSLRYALDELHRMFEWDETENPDDCECQCHEWSRE